MVGHDVGDQAEAMAAERRDETRAGLGATQLAADRRGIDDVVAVTASRDGFEHR